MFTQWIFEVLASAGAAATLLAAVAFLLRHLLVERLRRSVAHEYDARLETLRLDHTKVLEEVREARAERESLRTLAISLVTSAQAAVAERKVQAIDVLWQAFNDIRKSTPATIFVVDMLGYNQQNFGSALKAEMTKTNFLDAIRPFLLATEKVAKVRPFLGEECYALYHATQSLLGRATSTTLSSFRAGELKCWYEEEDTKRLLSSVLSEGEISTFGTLRSERLYWLVRHLESRLVQAIRQEISAGFAAQDVVHRAHAILIASEATAARTGDAVKEVA